MHTSLNHSLILLIIAAFFCSVSGCTTVKSPSSFTSANLFSFYPSKGRAWVLSEDSALLVMPPEPDAYDQHQHQAQLMQRQLQLALSQVFARVNSVEPGSSEFETGGYHYYVVPHLMQHLDRMNSMNEFANAEYTNGIGRDYLQVKLLLHNAHSGEILDTSVIEVYGTPFSFADRDFESLFYKAFSRYAGRLSAINTK